MEAGSQTGHIFHVRAFQIRNTLCANSPLIRWHLGHMATVSAQPGFWQWTAMSDSWSSAIFIFLKRTTNCLLHNCVATVVQYLLWWSWFSTLLHLASKGSWLPAPLNRNSLLICFPSTLWLLLIIGAADVNCCYYHQWLINPLVIDLLKLFHFKWEE